MTHIGPLEIVFVLVLAVGFSISVVTGISNVVVGVMAATTLLIAAFLSTRLSLYLLVFSMLLGPELIVGGLGGAAAGAASTAGRGVTLRFDDFLLVIVGFVWLVKAAIRKQEAPIKWTPLNAPIMLYVVACALTTFIGFIAGRVKPLTGFFFNVKYFEYFFLYFMVVNALTSVKEAKGLVTASLVTCFLVSLYAIAQIPGGGRASAPFEGETGEPNTLGGYLVFMLAIVTGLLITPESASKKWPLVVLLAFGAFAMMLTLSRASFLAAGIIAMVVIGKLSYRRPLLFTLVLLVLVSVPIWAPESVKNRILFTFTQKQERGQMQVGGIRVDTSTSARLESWQQTWVFFQESPIWGKGVTGGPFLDAMYPRILVETGMLGMVAFVFLLWAVAHMSLTCYREAPDPPTQGIALGFLLGLIGLLIHAIGSNTFIIVRIMEPFWLFAALLTVRFLAIRQFHPELGELPAADQVGGDGTGLTGTPAPVSPHAASLR
jgi:O-antigen ligase